MHLRGELTERQLTIDQVLIQSLIIVITFDHYNHGLFNHWDQSNPERSQFNPPSRICHQPDLPQLVV
jgi:hypothetical protein